MITEETKDKRNSNRNLIAEEYEARASILKGMPSSLIVEPGAICHLRCPFCPQTYNDFDLSREFIKLGDFKKIVDYFNDSLQHINLFNWGEPFLNESIIEMIEYAADHQIETDIHSTLDSLTAKLIERLPGSGLTRLTVSLDGASEETYQIYRKRGSFQRSYSHLKALVEKQKETGNKHFQIVWKFLVFRHNQHEMKKAQEMADELGVRIHFAYAEASGDYVSTLEEYNGTNFNKKFSREYNSQCMQAWKGPVVHSNGDILPCCQIYHKKYVLGNIFRQDFKSIWNNETYQKTRQVASGKIEADSSLCCYDCYFNPFRVEK